MTCGCAALSAIVVLPQLESHVENETYNPRLVDQLEEQRFGHWLPARWFLGIHTASSWAGKTGG